MYDDEFDSDWEALSIDEASRRAYALGVSESIGEPKPREYRRVKHGIERAYEKSIVELAYEEGRTRALKLRKQAEDKNPEDIWSALVEAEPITAGFGDLRQSGVPDAVTKGSLLDPPERRIKQIELPDFLTRR